jgi:hypothetical protein
VDSPAGPLRALPSPISLGGGVAPALGAVPALGEHTAAVLAEFGLADPVVTDRGLTGEAADGALADGGLTDGGLTDGGLDARDGAGAL